MAKQSLSKLRHDALRDTVWVGKSMPNLFLTLAGIVAGASLLAWLLH